MTDSKSLVRITNVVKHFDISGGFLDRLSFSGGVPSLTKTTVKALNDVSLDIQAGRNPVRGRGIGLRQVHPGPHGARALSAHQRRDRLSRRAHRPPLGQRDAPLPPQDADGLPGPLRLPQPAHDRAPDPGRADQLPLSRSFPLPGAGQGGRGHAPGGRGPGLGRTVSARILRRPAPAHQHRQGAHGRSGVHRRRRAHFGPRRVHPGPDFEPDHGLPGALRPDLHVHHPRPLRGRTHQHPRGRHVPRHPVRTGRQENLYGDPQHPYSRALLSAIPKLGGKGFSHMRLKGEVPTPINLPPGCVFHTRCPFTEERCRREIPALRTLPNGSRAACHALEEGRI
jgi:oligopeptide/dipeptide ABC transporter ATP-binding protein